MPIQSAVSRKKLVRLIAGSAAVIAAVGAAVASHPSQAQAAVPDRFAFVEYFGGAVISSGTTPSTTTVVSGGVGSYKVTFPGAGAKFGVVHVTAINKEPHWCQVNAFGLSGADEVVQLSCHKVGGALDASGFSAIYSASSGPSSTPGAFGYVDAQASGALVTQYNSAGAVSTVSHSSTGVWKANFPGLASPANIAGSWQATAVNKPTVPARCKVMSWTSSGSGQIAIINCYNSAGAPLDTEFTLTYQFQRSLYGAAIPPKYFGYLWNQPVGGPAPTSYNSAGGTNTLTAGTFAVVQFPGIGASPDDIQVTGSGQSSDFCTLDQPWGHVGADTVVKDITCYTNAGAHSASGFLISDSSAN